MRIYVKNEIRTPKLILYNITKKGFVFYYVLNRQTESLSSVRRYFVIEIHSYLNIYKMRVESSTSEIQLIMNRHQGSYHYNSKVLCNSNNFSDAEAGHQI